MRWYLKALALPIAVSLVAACTSLIGVNDLEIDPSLANTDGSTPLPDGNVLPDGAVVDGNLPPPDAACSDCPSEGATKCAGGQVQTCHQTGVCLKWSAAADCAKTADGVDQVCCAGGDAGQACIPVSATDCYACGTSCSGDTPQCLAKPKK